MPKHFVEELFESCGAILKGHFVLTSGRHTNTYLEKALVLTKPGIVSILCRQLALDILINKFSPQPIEVVVGPATCGIALSQWTCHHLSNLVPYPYPEIIAIFTEKDQQGRQVLKRGYRELVFGKAVAIVDDVFTTGGTLAAVAKEVEKAGGLVKTINVICARDEKIYNIHNVPIMALWRTKIESWSPPCPFCQEGVPLTDLKAR